MLSILFTDLPLVLVLLHREQQSLGCSAFLVKNLAMIERFLKADIFVYFACSYVPGIEIND